MSTPDNHSKRNTLLWMLAGLSAITGLIAILVGLRRKWRSKQPTETAVPPISPVHPSLVGLSEEEAETRRLQGQVNDIAFEPPRSPKVIIRANILTIFNLSLVGVAFVQLLLGLYWDMLLSLGVAVLNICLNVFQEILALRRLETLEKATRPQATVIREGKARSIDPGDIVTEDVLVIGPGDQILVDGEIRSEKPILIDESILTAEGRHLTKSYGDPVYAGSFCISGRAAYQAQKVGDERLVAGLLKNNQKKVDERTPLERVVERVLRVMMVVVLIMVALILSHTLRLDAAIGLDTDVIVSRVSVVFSLAPAGLYFMIFLNYIGSVRQLARDGALVHRARSVETLAYATSIFVPQMGSRAGVGVQVEDVTPPDDNRSLSKTRLRQILGDFGRSSYSNDQAVLALAEHFPGDKRSFKEQTPFLSVYGWVAIAFDEDDLRGVYVLGEPQALENYLIVEDGDKKNKNEQKGQPTSLRERLSIFRRFRRNTQEKQEAIAEEEQGNQKKIPSQKTISPEVLQLDPAVASKSHDQGAMRRLINRIGQVFKPGQATGEDPDESQSTEQFEQSKDEVIYLFAYHPVLSPLHDSAEQPQLPLGLIPLCNLHYSRQVNPETVKTIRTLRNSGVTSKFFSTGDPDRVIDLLEQAGSSQGITIHPQILTGTELEGLDKDELYQATYDNDIFGYVTHEQTRQMVAALRDHGDTVIVYGVNIPDLPIMQNANLSITSQDSSQATLGTADIILLKESPQALLSVMKKGQSVVGSVLDVLKLYLTQLAYLTTLILMLWALDLGFPYLSQQGAIISIATLALPSLALSLWEMPGALPPTSINRQLTWFVGPAALSISVAGLFVFSYFLNQSNQMAYAQLALTHMLVFSGLVLFVMVRPPQRTNINYASSEYDLRVTILAATLFIVFLIIASFPIAYTWFRLALLQQPGDYLVVGLAVLGWSVTVQFIWWLLSRKIGNMKDRQISDTKKTSHDTI